MWLIRDRVRLVFARIRLSFRLRPQLRPNLRESKYVGPPDATASPPIPRVSIPCGGIAAGEADHGEV